MTTQGQPAECAANDAAQVYRQLGQLTRQLHDALEQLGVMPGLQHAAEGLPDARSRLGYVARKTGEAADKVLDSVDAAKLEQGRVAARARRVLAEFGAAGAAQQPGIALLADFAREVDASAARMDRHLSDIMLAQDFHDLTGQVVAKVVALAVDVEDSLVKLLLHAAPADAAARDAAPPGLQGPRIDAAQRSDLVANQSEVDELLAGLGF